MKAYLRKLCAEAGSPLVAWHLVREYLQARILQSLQRAGAMQTIAFHGGTALRFLYNIPATPKIWTLRWSECLTPTIFAPTCTR